MSDRFSEIISCAMTAATNSSLYSPEHPSVSELSKKAIEIAGSLYDENDTLTITLLGNTLLFNNLPFNERSIHIHNFIRKLRLKGIDRIVIKKGATPKEFESFVLGLASRDGMRSTDNISVGVVEVMFKAGDDIRGFMDESIAKVKGVYEGVSRFKKLDVVGLDDAVAGFISVLKKEANVLNVVCPVKTYSEYTFVHTTNVAVLTIFQAETLGLKGDILREAGLAGLLHDSGKLFISKEVLEKKGKLDDSEWKEMKQHTVLGAVYLSTLPEVPKLAVVAAFEHHMKFDGSGYPDTKRRGKKQHLISQLIAISDFFDALRTERPYRRKLELKEIIGLMKESSGRDFNPLLIENFLIAFKKISAF